MVWLPLRDRLSSLPLVLAGPILRRTEPERVTVWVALRESWGVTLTVYATDEAGQVITRRILQGSRQTIALGQHLHLVAVTAIAPPNQSDADSTLHPGQIYAYDLAFTCSDPSPNQTLREALHGSGESPISMSYFEHGLPTFALPPQDIEQLRIVHGSCRKIHGYGQDTLPILDDLIGASADQPNQRPHQLFFTGDQIYGDDVADPMLYITQDAATTLLGWQEQLPLHPGRTPSHLHPSDLPPGHRSAIAAQQGGFTAGIRNKADYADSHLFSFGEYCTTYLLSWSPVLWSGVPRGEDIHLDHRQRKEWKRESIGIENFAKMLWKVRRALANVPTYMIFDDHDISDDWYLNQAWCLRVLGKPLGYRTVQNGLLAYTLCQGWGNTPEQFESGQIGEKLLCAAEQWCASESLDLETGRAIAQYLGLPPSDPATGLPLLRLEGDVWILDHAPESLRWYYTVRSDRHEVIVLDTRTWRGYPSNDQAIAPPMLLSPSAFQAQVKDALDESDRLNAEGQTSIDLTILVAPTNLVSLQVIDWVQHRQLHQGNVFDNDVGDAWNIHKSAFSRFLKTLFAQREQVVILSGDIHYGAMVRLNYWWYESGKTTAHVLTQLTSSALKNAEWKTRAVHTKLKCLVPEGDRELMGWSDRAEQIEIQTIQGLVWWMKRQAPGKPPTIQKFRLKTQRQVGVERAMALTQCEVPPDWHYRIEWIRRPPAQLFRRSVSWVLSLQPKRSSRFKQWLLGLWRNRWMQEGPEVVGEANLGVVQVHWSDHPKYRTVKQDLYWYASWNWGDIVFSRFQTQLPLPTTSETLETATQRRPDARL
ncbi:MAG: PhoD-like phosphatase [Synechococcales cyanobacterium T60_A2020_003]|nr:PhoD-like phosphatase [Synechococcales cyanobacterium T60_A2020_003]